VLFATFITLLLTPCIYLLSEKGREFAGLKVKDGIT